MQAKREGKQKALSLSAVSERYDYKLFPSLVYQLWLLLYSKPTPLPDSLSNEDWSNSEAGAVAEPADMEAVIDVQAHCAEVSDSRSYVILHLCFFFIVDVGFPVFKPAILAILMSL